MRKFPEAQTRRKCVQKLLAGSGAASVFGGCSTFRTLFRGDQLQNYNLVEVGSPLSAIDFIDGAGYTSTCRSEKWATESYLYVEHVSSEADEFVIFTKIGLLVFRSKPRNEASEKAVSWCNVIDRSSVDLTIVRWNSRLNILSAIQAVNPNLPSRQWELVIAEPTTGKWDVVPSMRGPGYPMQCSLSENGRLVVSIDNQITEFDVRSGTRRIIGEGRDASMNVDGTLLAYRTETDQLAVKELKTDRIIFQSEGKIEGGLEWSPLPHMGLVSAHSSARALNMMPIRKLHVFLSSGPKLVPLCDFRHGLGTLTLRWVDPKGDLCRTLKTALEGIDQCLPGAKAR